jgi:hypothetical protein
MLKDLVVSVASTAANVVLREKGIQQGINSFQRYDLGRKRNKSQDYSSSNCGRIATSDRTRKMKECIEVLVACAMADVACSSTSKMERLQRSKETLNLH